MQGGTLVNTQIAYSDRQISAQEQALYDHLLTYIDLEPPEQLVQRFQALFIEGGSGYPDRDIISDLDQILADKQVDLYFRHILNRCCHILINRWQSQRQSQSAIPQLVNLFEVGPTQPLREFSRSRSIQQLRQVVNQFVETEQYLVLKRLAQVISTPETAEPDLSQSRPLGTLIGRYPYLYEHCLIGEESSLEHQNHIRRIQTEAQQRFEVDLSHYVTYRARRAQLKRQANFEQRAQQLRPSTNPTLLTDRELVASLRQFAGKPEQHCSYQELAHRFLAQNCQAATYKSFKDDLYAYITSNLPTGYSNHKFNNLLHQQLADIYPDSNQKKLNDFLMVRTCSQLFNLLVVDSSASRQHFVFVDLINNLGPLVTTSLLLKIVLLCRKVKPYLERRFSILFGHYEGTAQSTVTWLVKVLESMNIALSLNFGKIDLSHMMQ
jgi:hypothetical protein